jgi:hypothetical protein
MNSCNRVLVLSLLVAITTAPTLLLANDGHERVHFFQSINVGPDENVGDVVCIGCSIRMSGSCGDAVAILGSIIIDGTVKGDAVAVGGTIKLGEDAQVGGDTVGLGGGIVRHPAAVVKGEMVSQSGPLVFIGLFWALS